MVALGEEASELLDWLLENSAVEKPSCVVSSKTSEEYPSLSLLMTEGDFRDMRCYVVLLWSCTFNYSHRNGSDLPEVN